MGHIIDAVEWWNQTGRKHGAKSKEVREWMLAPSNYRLEYFRYNRAEGGATKSTYLEPLKW